MRAGNIVYGAAALALASTARAQQDREEPQTFRDLIGGNRNLTRFRETLETYTELYEALSIVPGLTVLAPSDEAFNKIENSPLDEVFNANDTAAIRNVLNYHVLNGTFPKSAFNGSMQFPLTYMMDFATQKITPGQRISAVQQAGGELVFVSGLGSRCSVTEEDLQYNNGILHVIDTLLIPPQPFTNTSLQFNATGMAGAVIKTQLGNYFDNTRDVTIFAPNNPAFQRIGSAITNMNLDELGRIMKYHVVNGTVAYSSSMPNGTVLRSAHGGSLTITVGGNSLFVNSAKIVQQDLLLSNGVLHIIDNVLNFNATFYPNPELRSHQPDLYPSAQSTSIIPFTSDLPVTTTAAAAESSTSATGTETDAASATVSGEEASSTTSSSGATSTSARSEASSSLMDHAWGTKGGWTMGFVMMMMMSCASGFGGMFFGWL